MKKWILASWALCATLCLMLTSGVARAESPAPVKPVMSCEDLTKVDFSKVADTPTTIDSAKLIDTAKGKYCRVSGHVAPSVGFEVDLPAEHWMQRFLQVGCGGLCGNVNMNVSNAASCVPALNGELVISTDDMGHEGSMMDASWAADPQMRIDFAYRGNHVTALVSKALIAAYYGQAPRTSYFMGCSDGGREALMEAQRFPEDFDGITAGAPAAFFTFQNSFYHGWNVRGNQRADGTSILLKSRLPILHQAVLEHCSTLSGVKDGLLSDPYACKFDPAWVKQCAADATDKSACLTAEEIKAAENLYNGPRGAAGEQFIAGGLVSGSELNWAVPNAATDTPMSVMMAQPAIQWVVLPKPDPNTTIANFHFDQASFEQVSQLASLYNAANTNLAPFMKRGGKLILWHGLGDDSVTPAFTLAYYSGVQKQLGEEATDSFLRLFLLPGVGHCGHGQGYDQIDLLTPIIAWTEEHKAPAMILSEKVPQEEMHMPPMGGPGGPGAPKMGGAPAPMGAPAGAGADKQKAQQQFHGMMRPGSPLPEAAKKALASRPVFPYPYIAQYKGTGDVKDAANYVAVKSPAAKPFVLAEPAASFIGPDNQKFYHVEDGKLVADQAANQGK